MPTLAQQLVQDQAAYAGRVQTQATRFNNAPALNVIDTLSDPAFDLESAWDNGVLAFSIGRPLDYASCYRTAETLFPILTGPGAAVTAGTNPGPNWNSGQALRTEMAVMTTAMQQAAAAHQETVFRAEIAGHGTTLIVRADGTVEEIESLANGRQLTLSFPFPALPLATAVQALGLIFSDTPADRVNGATTFQWVANEIYLGTVAPDNDPIFPIVRFRWWSAALEAGWRARWMAQFTSRLTFLEAH